MLILEDTFRKILRSTLSVCQDREGRALIFLIFVLLSGALIARQFQNHSGILLVDAKTARKIYADQL